MIKKYLVIVMGCLVPFLSGWEQISIHELAAQKVSAQKPSQLYPFASTSSLAPLQILEKATGSFYKLKSMRVQMETWFENPLFHIKASFDNLVNDIDNYQTNGKISLSLLLPDAFSTSQWVQTYKMRGIPFTWDLNKRQWLKEELKISDQEAKEKVAFSVLQSLFTVNEQGVDLDSVQLLGIDKRQGQKCYVLRYNIADDTIKRWGMVGSITVKTWVGMDDFLPRVSRAEGKLADMYILQVVEYSEFNSASDIVLPEDVAKRIEEEKEQLLDKEPILAEAITGIRGWKDYKHIPIEFVDRPAFGAFLTAQLEKTYGPQKYATEGLIMKWLGLLHKDADYKESMWSSQIASIAALYDPEQKKILLGDWLPPEFIDAVLVHEMVHAFQDQQFGIEKTLAEKEALSDLDASFAYKSLLEGDATSIMLEYLLKDTGSPGFEGLEDIFALIEDKLFRQSAYSAEHVLFNIYGYGTHFIQSYIKQYSWPDVDKIYAYPPVSMREVMHPEQFVPKEAADESVFQRSMVAPVLEGWQEIYKGRLGEFLLMLSLRVALDKDTVDKAILGWQQDSISVLENTHGSRIVYYSAQWNDLSLAGEFFKAYTQGLQKRFPSVSPDEGRDDYFLGTDDGQWFVCWVKDASVSIVWSQELKGEEFKTVIKQIRNN